MNQSQFVFEAIGTKWIIDLYGTPAEADLSLLEMSIQQRIADFDQTYSRFRTDSLITKMANAAGVYPLPSDAKPLLDLYSKIYRLSFGALTPLIGQLISDAGYDASYSLQSKPLKPVLTWQQVIDYSDTGITLHQPALLDFGAAGKGYLIDLVAQLIEEFGIKTYCIDAGGDLRYRGKDILRIGMENPQDSDQVIGVIELKNQSLCASSGSRRTWGNYHHIFDPRLLASSREVLATWVLSDSTIEADILATGLFLVEPSSFSSDYDFEYLILYPDYSVIFSPGFPGEVFEK